MLKSLGRFLIIFFTSLAFGSSFNFYIKTNKKIVYVGEEFKIVYTFTYKDGSKIADVNFSPPIFKDLHIKNKKQNQTKNSQSWIFTLSAYKDKNITIKPAYLDIALKKDDNKIIGNFNEYDYEYISLETKPIVIEVTNHQNGIRLFGDFTISAKVLQKENVTDLDIVINGDGNFEDISPYKLQIKDATIYEEKPLIEKNSFRQKFVILSSKSFSIPSFELKYIDKKQKKIKIKKTSPIFVKINQKKSTQNTKKSSHSYSYKEYIYFLLLFLFGVLFGFMISRYFKKKKSFVDLTLLEKIKKSKNTKEILKLLISNNKNNKYKDIIQQLEEDIYINKKLSINKKDIIKKIFTQY